MGFWWFMLICTLLTPLLMIIAGRMMWKHCPPQHQQHLRLPHRPLHAEHGHLALRP